MPDVRPKRKCAADGAAGAQLALLAGTKLLAWKAADGTCAAREIGAKAGRSRLRNQITCQIAARNIRRRCNEIIGANYLRLTPRLSGRAKPVRLNLWLDGKSPALRAQSLGGRHYSGRQTRYSTLCCGRMRPSPTKNVVLTQAYRSSPLSKRGFVKKY